MAKSAIVALKDRTGSSPQAIEKWIISNFSKLAFKKHLLRSALKKGLEDGTLALHHIHKGSYKLGAAAKAVSCAAALVACDCRVG